MSWDLARLWHTLARHHPDRPALIHNGQTLSWRQFDTAAAAFAAVLRRAGVRRGDVIALCLPNMAEYLVLFAAALRCGATPCGINYRYRDHELAALLRHIEPAVVCHQPGRHTPLHQARLPGVRSWHPVDAGQLPLLDTAAGPARLDCHPDDALIKCTGGTTGTPAALRWRVGDVLQQLNDHNPWHRHDLSGGTLRPARAEPVRLLVAGPLVHGSALTRALGALCAGGTVITLPDTGYHPQQMLDTLARHRATSLAIVGDAHALPLADTLDTAPGHWPLPHLASITSSGAAWTHHVKRRLLHHLPHLRLLESLGATEATGLGFSVANSAAIPPTGEFTLGRHARVFTDGRPTAIGQVGNIGVSRPHPTGLHPTGHLPDDRYTVHKGARYLLSGDHVELHDNRRLRLLGRPADCINTGGEKVYAPEVADTLRRHPGVRDALVLGTPHPRLGQTIAALVQLDPATPITDILAHARTHLAGYKMPTILREVPAIPRTSTGKPDLTAARALAAQHDDGP